MYIRREKGPVGVRLPDGSILMRSDLPAPGTRRWVGRRKAAVVAAVEHGLIGIDEALERYDLSSEEFAQWRDAFNRHGEVALRITAIQRYRPRSPAGLAPADA